MNTQTQSLNVVEAFVNQYGFEAIPALIAGSVAFTVNIGGCEIIKHTLRSAIKLADDMQEVRIRVGN